MKSFFAIIFLLLIAFVSTSSFKSTGNEDLSVLMDRMTKETKQIKKQIDSGKTQWKGLKKYGVDYQIILTAIPSDASKKGEHFDDFALSFLKETERLRNSDESGLNTQYNAVITACINCHSSYCPGPISMLKRMKVKE